MPAPSSPLSGNVTSSNGAPLRRQAARRNEMHLSSLPPFHPAVYCAPNSGQGATSAPSGSKTLAAAAAPSSGTSSSSEMMPSPFYSDSLAGQATPRTVQRQFSEAQARLRQYTHDSHGAAWGLGRQSSAQGHRRQPSSPGVLSPLAGGEGAMRPSNRRSAQNSPRSHSRGSPAGTITPFTLEMAGMDIEDPEQGGYLVAGAVRGGVAAELGGEEHERLVDAMIERETGAAYRR